MGPRGMPMGPQGPTSDQTRPARNYFIPAAVSQMGESQAAAFCVWVQVLISDPEG